MADHMFQDFWKNRKLIWKLSRNDFKTRYAGSYFGVLWAMVQPVVIVLVYWFVFQIGLNNATAELKQGIHVPFVLWLVSGIVPWFYFSESLSNGTNALLEYHYLVKKVVFNINILPLVKTIAALFIHVFFVLFMILLFALYGYYPGLHTLAVVYFSASLMVFVTGVCMLTSALVVFFRDLSQIINIFLQVGIWMTPIMWSLEDLLAKYPILMVLKLNPLCYIVYGYRAALFQTDSIVGLGWMHVYFWAVTVLIWAVGSQVFRKLKVHFADVL
ncbi:MAG: ABC transporter permease [Lachnospiraceae bacterium]|nr:ABC transporter permease [Lachnospiraceae bacterium]